MEPNATDGPKAPAPGTSPLPPWTASGLAVTWFGIFLQGLETRDERTVRNATKKFRKLGLDVRPLVPRRP